MNNMIEQTIAFVKKQSENYESGHDWFHTERVWKTSLKIAEEEGADTEIVQLAALLHDIGDSKFFDGDETIGPRMVEEYLTKQNLDSQKIKHIVNIIKHMSFHKSFEESKFESQELHCVQDADKLDAMGAIGIARAFSFGGHKNRTMYDPDIKPQLNMTKEQYKKREGTTINHFYEKLLKLKDMMKTTYGKKLAQKRHDFMVQYLDEFYKEWNASVA